MKLWTGRKSKYLFFGGDNGILTHLLLKRDKGVYKINTKDTYVYLVQFQEIIMTWFKKNLITERIITQIPSYTRRSLIEIKNLFKNV